jgi:hypothetical protein
MGQVYEQRRAVTPAYNKYPGLILLIVITRSANRNNSIPSGRQGD